MEDTRVVDLKYERLERDWHHFDTKKGIIRKIGKIQYDLENCGQTIVCILRDSQWRKKALRAGNALQKCPAEFYICHCKQ